MKRVVRLACLLLAVCLSAVMFLGWTAPGLRLLAGGIERVSGGMITFGAVNGGLLTSFQLENIQVTTPAVQLRLGRFTFSWRAVELLKNRLHVVSLSASDVDVLLQEQEDVAGEEKPDRSGSETPLPKLAVPVAFVLDRLTVEDVRLLAPDSSELTAIEHLSFGLAGSSQQIRLTDFALTSPGYGAMLQGLVDPERDWYVEIAGKVEYKDYGVGPFAGDVSLQGPLARLDTVVDLYQPARGHVEGQIMDLPNGFSWKADLALHDAQLADGHEVLPELLFSATGTAEGEFLSYSGSLQGNLDYLFFKDVSVEIELAGNEDQIAFAEITAVNDRGKAHLTDGLLSWQDKLLWRGQLELQDFDPGVFAADYPGAINAELSSSGTYDDTAGLELDVDLRTFSGMLRGYALQGRGRLQLDEHAVSVDDFLLQSGSATLQVDGRAASPSGLARWRESLSWKGELHLVDFDPALFFPDYPGAVSAEVTSGGNIAAENIQGRAEISSLTGVLRGYPVNGQGAVRMDDQILYLDDLLLQSGRSRLQISGQVTDMLDISVALNSPDIGEFLEGASGELTVDGEVSGDRNVPRFDAALVAKELAFEKAGISRLELHLSGGMDYESSLSAQLKGNGLDLGAMTLQEVELDLAGAPGDHTFSAALQAQESSVELHGRGGLDEDDGWAGSVHDLRVSSPEYGTWQQDGEAAVAVSGQKTDVESLCLKDRKESICLSGGWLQDQGRWRTELNWTQIDLSRLNGLFTMSESIWGRSSAAISASGNLTRLESADGFLEIADAGIGYAEEQSEWDALQLDTSVLTLNLTDGMLKADLAADFADGSSLGITTEAPGFGAFERDVTTLPLRGKIRADLQNIEFVAPLSHYVVRPSGSLQGTLDISGTVVEPVAAGKLVLADGQLDMPGLGIRMKDVLFEVAGTGNTLALQATASSGPGTLRAAGNLSMDGSGIAGDFRFTGENFDTFMLPEYEIRTNPDLRFVFDSDGGMLTGHLNIPHAVLAPERMTDSLSVSDDVIYLDGEEEESASGWLFSTSLQIEFGDDVWLDGYGVTGYLRGKLLVEKTAGSHMTGKGELSLAEGVFSVYGRTLRIDRNRLLFAGGPIDNPGVDVRAKKIVADKKKRNETIEVGVEVSGTADDLEFVLFSDPPMEDSDILAYMVVGRAMSDVGQQDESLLNSAAVAMGLEKSLGIFDDLSELLLVDELYLESGMGDEMSLVVGKHLTDQLFIGYGHNFFDQKGEVRLRYDLGAGFSVESRSSGDVTGADLLYSFER